MIEHTGVHAGGPICALTSRQRTSFSNRLSPRATNPLPRLTEPRRPFFPFQIRDVNRGNGHVPRPRARATGATGTTHGAVMPRRHPDADIPPASAVTTGCVLCPLAQPLGRTPVTRSTARPREIILTKIGGCRPPRRECPRNHPHRDRGCRPPLVREGPRNHPHGERSADPPRREGP